LIKRLASIIKSNWSGIISAAAIFMLLVVWQLACAYKLVPGYLLPSPIGIAAAFARSLQDLVRHSQVTLYEAFSGLAIGIGAGFVMAVLMDNFITLYRLLYPLMVISQTIPVIAIAPLLVVWLGYGVAPKIALVVLVCFFPVTIGLLDGFRNADPDAINLLKAMGASRRQIFWHIKLPYGLSGFFSGLKISVSYSIVGAVIAEWIGGNEGLGVYMMRVRRSYRIDEMFAVIFLIIIISLLLIWLVKILEKFTMPWKAFEEKNKT